jgi:acetylornithine deacetylase/succinyl-diaminopimelate desuccinylase-like protein
MKTIVAHGARTSLHFRLVPEQEPTDVFGRVRTHVEAISPHVAVRELSSFPPMRTPVDVPVADHVRSALEAVWGEDVVELPRMGGSLPATLFRIVEGLEDVPVLVVPYANPDQDNHAPNEHLDLDCFENGLRTTAEFLRRFADAS